MPLLRPGGSASVAQLKSKAMVNVAPPKGGGSVSVLPLHRTAGSGAVLAPSLLSSKVQGATHVVPPQFSSSLAGPAKPSSGFAPNTLTGGDLARTPIERLAHKCEPPSSHVASCISGVRQCRGEAVVTAVSSIGTHSESSAMAQTIEQQDHRLALRGSVSDSCSSSRARSQSPLQRRPAPVQLQARVAETPATSIQDTDVARSDVIRVSELNTAVELIRSEVRAAIQGSDITEPLAQAPRAPAVRTTGEFSVRPHDKSQSEMSAHAPQLEEQVVQNGVDSFAKQPAHVKTDPHLPSILSQDLAQDLSKGNTEGLVQKPAVSHEAGSALASWVELEPSARTIEVEVHARAEARQIVAQVQVLAESASTSEPGITTCLEPSALGPTSESPDRLPAGAREVVQPNDAISVTVQVASPLAIRTKRRSTSVRHRSPTLCSIEETEVDSHDDQALASDGEEVAASATAGCPSSRMPFDGCRPRLCHKQAGGRTLVGRQGSRLGWVNQENHMVMALSEDQLLIAIFDSRSAEGRDVVRGVRQVFEEHAHRVLSARPQEALRALFQLAQKDCMGPVTASCFAVAVAFVDLRAHLVTSAHIGDMKFMISSGLKVLFETTACVFGEASPEVTTASSDTGGPALLASQKPEGSQDRSRCLVPEVNAAVSLPPGSTMILATAGVWGKLSPEAIAAHMMISSPETAAFSVVLEARSRWPRDGDVADLAAVIVKGSPSQSVPVS